MSKHPISIIHLIRSSKPRLSPEVGEIWGALPSIAYTQQYECFNGTRGPAWTNAGGTTVTTRDSFGNIKTIHFKNHGFGDNACIEWLKLDCPAVNNPQKASPRAGLVMASMPGPETRYWVATGTGSGPGQWQAPRVTADFPQDSKGRNRFHYEFKDIWGMAESEFLWKINDLATSPQCLTTRSGRPTACAVAESRKVLRSVLGLDPSTNQCAWLSEVELRKLRIPQVSSYRRGQFVAVYFDTIIGRNEVPPVPCLVISSDTFNTLTNPRMLIVLQLVPFDDDDEHPLSESLGVFPLPIDAEYSQMIRSTKLFSRPPNGRWTVWTPLIRGVKADFVHPIDRASCKDTLYLETIDSHLRSLCQ